MDATVLLPGTGSNSALLHWARNDMLRDGGRGNKRGEREIDREREREMEREKERDEVRKAGILSVCVRERERGRKIINV